MYVCIAVRMYINLASYANTQCACCHCFTVSAIAISKAIIVTFSSSGEFQYQYNSDSQQGDCVTTYTYMGWERGEVHN